jgi:hypothetical protein
MDFEGQMAGTRAQNRPIGLARRRELARDGVFIYNLSISHALWHLAPHLIKQGREFRGKLAKRIGCSIENTGRVSDRRTADQ